MKKYNPLYFIKIIAISFLMIISFIGFLACSFFTILPTIDLGLCNRRIENNLGIKGGYYEIQNLIESSLKTGMTRKEVEDVIKKYGSISIVPGKEIFNGQTTDQVVLKICLHPFNNMIFYAHYDKDGTLIFVEIETQDN